MYTTIRPLLDKLQETHVYEHVCANFQDPPMVYAGPYKDCPSSHCRYERWRLKKNNDKEIAEYDHG